MSKTRAVATRRATPSGDRAGQPGPDFGPPSRTTTSRSGITAQRAECDDPPDRVEVLLEHFVSEVGQSPGTHLIRDHSAFSRVRDPGRTGAESCEQRARRHRRAASGADRPAWPPRARAAPRAARCGRRGDRERTGVPARVLRIAVRKALMGGRATRRCARRSYEIRAPASTSARSTSAYLGDGQPRTCVTPEQGDRRLLRRARASARSAAVGRRSLRSWSPPSRSAPRSRALRSRHGRSRPGKAVDMAGPAGQTSWPTSPSMLDQAGRHDRRRRVPTGLVRRAPRSWSRRRRVRDHAVRVPRPSVPDQAVATAIGALTDETIFVRVAYFGARSASTTRSDPASRTSPRDRPAPRRGSTCGRRPSTCWPRLRQAEADRSPTLISRAPTEVVSELVAAISADDTLVGPACGRPGRCSRGPRRGRRHVGVPHFRSRARRPLGSAIATTCGSTSYRSSTRCRRRR